MTLISDQNCVMGFDFGEARIGIAVTNQATSHTQPLATVNNKANGPDWQQITQLVTTWHPALFVVGKTGKASDTLQKKIALFAMQLQERYQCPVNFVEEAYTSTEAKYHLTEQRKLGLVGKNHTGKLDKIAAALILDTWLALKTSA